jgi:hypothetical protein
MTPADLRERRDRRAGSKRNPVQGPLRGATSRRAPRPAKLAAIVARRPGKCYACPRNIRPEDQITFIPMWIHALRVRSLLHPSGSYGRTPAAAGTPQAASSRQVRHPSWRARPTPLPAGNPNEERNRQPWARQVLSRQYRVLANSTGRNLHTISTRFASPMHLRELRCPAPARGCGTLVPYAASCPSVNCAGWGDGECAQRQNQEGCLFRPANSV